MDTEKLGPKLGTVPLLSCGPIRRSATYPGRLGPFPRLPDAATGARPDSARVATAAFVMVMWDVLMDPAHATIGKGLDLA